MILYYGATIAAIIPIIWILFLRRIDLFKQLTLLPIIIVCALGALTPFLVQPIYKYIIDPTNIIMDGTIPGDLLYCVVCIGLPEELMKMLPVFLVLLIYPKIIKEPFDLIIFAAVSALGFSFHENILYVFKYGYTVIPGRSIVSSPFHMFTSSIFIYGLIIFRYKKTVRNKWFNLFWFPVFAILSHGIFDFFIITTSSLVFPILSIIYYMIIISIVAVILNNTLNQSSGFSMKVVVNSDRTIKFILSAYGVLILCYVAGTIFSGSEKEAIEIIRDVNYVNVGMVAIMITRLSRIKLIEGNWFPLKFELPFTYHDGIYVKGEGLNETYINQYLEENIRLFPFPLRLNPEKKRYPAYIERKIYSKDLQPYYLTKVYKTDEKTDFEYHILMPKTGGTTEFNTEKPIAAFMKLEDPEMVNDPDADYSTLPFLSWVEIISDAQ
jgi:RsiW-degrading membrane proteinase PrsW (M82 family)